MPADLASTRRFYLRALFGDREKQRLLAALDELSTYCRAPETPRETTADLHEAMKGYTYWPQQNLLKRISGSVTRLATLEREKQPKPLWKAFRLVDNRTPSLRVVSRVDGVVRRAKDRIDDVGESGLMLVRHDARAGNVGARALLYDIALIRKDEKRARGIKWKSHQSLLATLSGGGVVKLACGTPPSSEEARCYARVLELIIDDDRRKPLLGKCQPLLTWLVDIGHPKAGVFGAFNQNTVSMAEIEDLVTARKKRDRERQATRERVKRHRLRKDSSPE